MATLLVRKLDETVVARLKARAKANGRSVEAEHRAILETALSPASAPKSGKELWEWSRRYAGGDLDELPNEEVRPATFD